MKIAVIGYSGAGKSTLARQLGEAFGAPVLHLDAVGWSAGWRLRDVDEARSIVAAFLGAHDGWVVEGNWRKLDRGRRYAEADVVVMLDFPRARCLWRAWRRHRSNQGAEREDMAAGCPEKFDLAFVRWILHDGRTRSERDRYERVAADFPDKMVVLKNPRDVAAFLESMREHARAEAEA
ncbi:DNA topology modulation protein FlaR [Gordonibacter massiliensis (ex Traore et al. 2017)]|uniref:DNA topology modulation protein FlaR n=1 Tax=Gordonibacter massiliensis (ex Traore et al. 2017) TaxID=1841863 RepID=A0A842JG28_9ACTN|nr:DNA topology modulation protein FlaR [Gordonibacter massiliensis (ex Traore et al. 2017)]MBC2890384.1 DNA topology modulation protein FlaR [Gordonibacter massiliensis (ex Traore et al. 2017)]